MGQEATFDQFLEWLQTRSKPVYLEVGTEATDVEVKADAITVAMYVTIEGIGSATNLDAPDRMGVIVRLSGGERNRLYLDPERITRIETHMDVWKVWFFDRFYLGLTG